ncbi:MAG: aldo/keto reductase [Lentisphaerae bacterium]|nr:aldo/keto reductase [Lentisphaerota bacterium]
MMKQHTLDGTELNVSTFCYGTMQFGHEMELAQRDKLFGLFRDAGGNFFDTAHCYCSWLPCHDGASERILGDYIQRTGCRDEVIIATKGAHPSVPNYRRVETYMSAGRIAADLDDSLSRLQVDTIDLYWLHRDDPRMPVGEIMDILNAERGRGRIRAFGGSNWTAPRLAEANAYAAEHGVAGFVGSQPRWNLACDDEEPEGGGRLEPGVLLALSLDDAAWHAESQLPVMPYSPTAIGFFGTEGERPEKLRTDANLDRLDRAKQLASELGATSNQVALAWLLHHPFPVFPILGTGSADHLLDALGADSIALTPEQVSWLRDG